MEGKCVPSCLSVTRLALPASRTGYSLAASLWEQRSWGNTLRAVLFCALLPSLYAEGIWGLAMRGRAVCCGFPAPHPLICPFYSQCPCLRAHLFPFPELLAGFLAVLRPFLCSLFLRGLAPGVGGAHRRVQCPRTADPPSLERVECWDGMGMGRARSRGMFLPAWESQGTAQRKN